MIFLKSFRLGHITIAIPDIKSIKQESSFKEKKNGISRAMSRISIYDKDNNFVDISLKHFQPEDIRKLMMSIHSIRPELDFPKAWINPPRFPKA